MRKLSFVLGITLALGALLLPSSTLAAFDQGRVIDDDVFINKGSMSGVAIQNFLAEEGSVLAGYSENGRSAASIIYDAAQANRINPQVLLATLQKEQSLLSLRNYNTSTDPEGRLRKAMGYACPDSGGCDSKYAGFTNQVDGAAFQLRYNYDCSQVGESCPKNKLFTASSGYRVGDTMTFDGTAVTLYNRATASLYRYTPHISGNRSFYNSFFTYYIQYAAFFSSQNGYPTLAPGDSYKFSAQFQNTGNRSWSRNVIKLGTNNPKDRISPFLRENWLNGDDTMWMADNRVALKESTVPIGGLGTFDFYMTVPPNMRPGTYREAFRPVAESIAWLDDSGLYWDVNVVNHQAAWAGQNFGSQRVEPGQSIMMEVSLRNTGQTTWKRDSRYPVQLGTSRKADRMPIFIREDRNGYNPSGWLRENRIQMQEAVVAPGEVGTFRFWYTVPTSVKPGTYREYFNPVHDGVAWFSDLGIYFDIIVDTQKASWSTQSNHVTLAKGESAQFTVQFRNDGTTTWNKNGDTPMRLGTLRKTDRVPGFIRDDVVTHNTSGWLKENRVQMVEDSVAPGQLGTFTFWYTVPGDKAPGTYREFFGLVQDNYAWLPDPGVYWDITVR